MYKICIFIYLGKILCPGSGGDSPTPPPPPPPLQEIIELSPIPSLRSGGTGLGAQSITNSSGGDPARFPPSFRICSGRRGGGSLRFRGPRSSSAATASAHRPKVTIFERIRSDITGDNANMLFGNYRCCMRYGEALLPFALPCLESKTWTSSINIHVLCSQCLFLCSMRSIGAFTSCQQTVIREAA